MQALPAIMLAVSVGGTLMSSVGSVMKGQAEKEAYEFNAEQVLRETRRKARAARQEARSVMGRQAALMSSAGVDISSGSPLLRLAETAEEGKRQELEIMEAGRTQAELYRMYGGQAASSGMIGGISSFLAGLGGAGMEAYKSGMFDKTKVRIR